ncbi:uncharacterized protein LOC131693131 isoform X2 [Topomyia yanbarensis]|uniref:uncharacterized protein LOC131693131 isoform X2 n=1 Tax=Topomyia yanbarensis TaxID=2498891 RepID=UPI00273CD9CA|nr:uncharacterized protein LOC131693131 isoform X2 [Topomyia yanbarensis]
MYALHLVRWKMSDQIEQVNLPPGWDCRYDARTGRYYYVNLFTKTTTWEDPRSRIRQLQTGAPLHISNDNISVQPMHGSPYHVYPSSNSFYPAQQAFQNPPSGVPSLTASPNFATKLQQQQLELAQMARSSPHTPRMGLGRNVMQETSFSSNVSAADTDATVAKINSMFPTVPETHIRMLLKKYYNREAVVISALQVEKHPLTTPGPYSTPPLPQRHFHNTAMGVVSAFQMTPVLGGRSEVSTSRTGSPIPRPASCASGSYYGYQHGSPRSNGIDIRYSSPKPHSSPKMKLRYLKSFFPKAEETLILDVLANADNNVQTASQALIKLGYEKREQQTAQRSSSRKGSEKDGHGESGRSETPPVKPKTPDEMKKIKARLQAKYKDIAERIISMALESVDYSEDRAKQILNIVIQEDKEKKKSVKIDAPYKPEEDKENAQTNSTTPSRSNSTSSPRRSRAKKANANSDDHSVGSEAELVVGSNSPTDPATIHHKEDQTSEDNENEASIQITTSTSSTAIINDSPPPPISSSPSRQQRGTANNYNQQQQQQNSGTDLNNNSNYVAPAAVGVASSTGKQSRTRAKGDHAKNSSSEDELDGLTGATSSKSDSMNAYNAARITTKGPNTKLFRGPNDDLLLADYVTWNGANPDLARGSQKLAMGPDRSIRIDRTYKAHGANGDLCKGPAGLAKGSIYAQLNCTMKDVKCN